MKKNFLSIIILLLSLLNPIFCFLLLLFTLKSNNKLYVILSSILVFHLSINFSPTESYDYFRYTQRVDSYNSFLELYTVFIIQNQTNFIFPVLSYLINIIVDNSKITLALISSLTTFLSIYSLEKKLNKTNTIDKWIIILSLSYIFVISGIRFNLGVSLLIFAYTFKNNLRWTFLILSILTHLSLLIYAPLFFLREKLVNRNINILLLLVTFLFSSLILNIVSNSIIPVKGIDHFIYSYITMNAEYNRNIYLLLVYFSISFVVIYRIFLSNITNHLLIISIYLMLFINLPIIYDRYLMVAITIGVVPNIQSIFKKEKLIILLTLIFRQVIDIYSNIDVISDSYFNLNFII